MRKSQSILLVANWNSDVGYAWWLMESYWVLLAQVYHRDHRVILTFRAITSLSEKIARAPVEPVALDMCRRGFRAVWAQCRFLRRNHVRLMYCSDWEVWRWRYLAYRFSGVRTIIVHDHSPGVRVAPTGVKRWMKQLINRIPGLTVDGALGATEFVRRRLVDVTCFPVGKCFAVPNGLPDLDSANRVKSLDIRAEFDVPPNCRILVMTGRATRYKRVDFVIRCLARLVSEGRRDLHFLYVGDGPHLDYFRETGDQLGVSGHCTFAGRREDIPELLMGCDIAIHPSAGEVGYSLSILEYMRAGLPVLVPDNPSVCGATVHEETGLVYAENNLESATGCLRRLLDDADLSRRLGRAARETVTRDHRLDAAHEALAGAFRRLDPAWPAVGRHDVRMNP